MSLTTEHAAARRSRLALAALMIQRRAHPEISYLVLLPRELRDLVASYYEGEERAHIKKMLKAYPNLTGAELGVTSSRPVTYERAYYIKNPPIIPTYIRYLNGAGI